MKTSETRMFVTYWKEIICLLVIKAILFTGIWYKYFRSPLTLDDKAAGEHILGKF